MGNHRNGKCQVLRKRHEGAHTLHLGAMEGEGFLRLWHNAVIHCALSVVIAHVSLSQEGGQPQN